MVELTDSVFLLYRGVSFRIVSVQKVKRTVWKVGTMIQCCQFIQWAAETDVVRAGNDVIDILTSENMENTPLEPRM